MLKTVKLMLKYIHIQNFRCFENFRTEGFERVNLIGGKNNSGKTCLLEAIASFSNTFNTQALFELRSKDLNSIIYKNKKTNKLIIESSINNDELRVEGEINGATLGDFARKTNGVNINFISQKNA